MAADRTRRPEQKLVLCAIYTRKSTDENLNTDFNSLDAQREYCQAFIKSREGEGWRVYPETYEDPGFSGGNMERPALRKLLADARAGKFHVVICYKYDRLSRQTKDFLHILDIFDQHGVAFVSVTQPIDTTSSVGRLMRSILMDFAQFEREMIAERVRDKLAGMARKGKRTGGHPIIGYDIDRERKALVVNPTEAQQAIEMFKTYTETKSLSATAKALNAKGYRMKRWVTGTSRERGGAPFNKGSLFYLLKNVLYIGKIVHRKQVYQGEHQGIVPEDLFNEVQALISRNQDGRAHRAKRVIQHNFILRGLVRCAVCGTAMTPQAVHWRGGRNFFFYYKCVSVNKLDKTACPVRHVPAGALEEHVLKRLETLGASHDLLSKIVGEVRTMAVQELPAKREQRRTLALEQGRVQVVGKNLLNHLAQEAPGSEMSEKIKAEIADCIQREKELKELIDKLDREIAELEKREVDAAVVQRNLAGFKEFYGRLSPAEQKELVELLVHQVIFDYNREEKRGRITVELNVLPDLWGDAASEGDYLVYRQRWLPSSYPQQSQSRIKKPLVLWHEVPCGVILERRGRQKIVDKAAFQAHQEILDKKAQRTKTPRIQEVLRMAHEIKARLDADPRLRQWSLAAELRLHQGQLSRFLRLAGLAPEIQRHIMAMPPSEGRGVVTERRLRPIALLSDPKEQMARFQELLRQPLRTRKAQPPKVEPGA